MISLQWRHNERDGVSNHQPRICLLNRLFRRRSRKTSKLRVTGLCVGNSPVTGEFSTQRASNEEILSIWWRHHVTQKGITRQCVYLGVFACHHDTMLILHSTQRGHSIIGHNKHPCRISIYLTTVWRKMIRSIFVITDTRTNDITSLDGYKLW